MTRYFDNTRLGSYKECPRKYYFRHVRHWRGSGLAASLGFGLAWHEAMDQVWTGAARGQDPEETHKKAMVAFDLSWSEQGFPSWNDMDLEAEQKLSPRTPGVAAEMLHCYIQERWPFLTNKIELLAVERPFCVDLGIPNVFYVGRRDKDISLEGRIISPEHKTTTAYKKEGGFRNDYLESWSPDSQVDGYIHSGHMDYGKKFWAVWIDAALVHKTVHDKFRFIPVDRMLEHMEGWLSDVKAWIDQVFRDERALERQRQEKSNKGDALNCFRKNTKSCFGKYGACGYVDICRFVSNPETLDEPPEGFIIEKWEPFNILELGKIDGLEPEEA